MNTTSCAFLSGRSKSRVLPISRMRSRCSSLPRAMVSMSCFPAGEATRPFPRARVRLPGSSPVEAPAEAPGALRAQPTAQPASARAVAQLFWQQAVLPLLPDWLNERLSPYIDTAPGSPSSPRVSGDSTVTRSRYVASRSNSAPMSSPISGGICSTAIWDAHGNLGCLGTPITSAIAIRLWTGASWNSSWRSRLKCYFWASDREASLSQRLRMRCRQLQQV